MKSCKLDVESVNLRVRGYGFRDSIGRGTCHTRAHDPNTTNTGGNLNLIVMRAHDPNTLYSEYRKKICDSAELSSWRGDREV